MSVRTYIYIALGLVLLFGGTGLMQMNIDADIAWHNEVYAVNNSVQQKWDRDNNMVFISAYCAGKTCHEASLTDLNTGRRY